VGGQAFAFKPQRRARTALGLKGKSLPTHETKLTGSKAFRP